MATDDISPVFVAADQERESRHTNLVEQLSRYNVPALQALHQPVDLLWVVDGRPVFGELKTPVDLIASYQDGRLHNQVMAMLEVSPLLAFVCIEGSWSDDGDMVGGEHGWAWDAFDNAVLRLQMDGIKIIHSPSTGEKTVRRIAALWKWTRDSIDKVGSYHSPTAIEAFNVPDKNIWFYDATVRSHAGMLMHLPDCGIVTAHALRDAHPLMDILGITEEGLARAKRIWVTTKGIGKKTIAKWEEYLRY
jgi:hypothetical protein